MSADAFLREAAEKLRGLATAATPGPWAMRIPHDSTREDLFGRLVCVGNPPLDITPAGGDLGDDGLVPADALLIATLHPGVAIALADWLDAEAAFHAEVAREVIPLVESGWRLTGATRSTLPQALAVSAVILGRTWEL